MEKPFSIKTLRLARHIDLQQYDANILSSITVSIGLKNNNSA